MRDNRASPGANGAMTFPSASSSKVATTGPTTMRNTSRSPRLRARSCSVIPPSTSRISSATATSRPAARPIPAQDSIGRAIGRCWHPHLKLERRAGTLAVMILFTLLVGLAIDRVWDAAVRLRSFAWFMNYSARLRRGLGSAPWADGPLGVLVYTLGPRDLERDVRRFLNAWEQGDEGEAWALVREIDGDADTADYYPDSLGRVAIEGISIAAHERILGVIFWFVALGPVGAFLFRMICLLREHGRRDEPHSGFTRAVEVAYGLIGWPSSRLAALGYALVGSFADALYRRRETAAPPNKHGVLYPRRVRAASGLGALQVDDEALDDRGFSVLQVRAALAMAWRTVILALALVALATLGGWLF